MKIIYIYSGMQKSRKNKCIYLFIVNFWLFLPHVFTQQNCDTAKYYEILDLTKISVPVKSNGSSLFGNKQEDENYPWFKFPKSSNLYPFEAGGLIIGGKDKNGRIKLAMQSGMNEPVDFYPGPFLPNDSLDSMHCLQYDIVWKVSKQHIDRHIEYGLQYDVANGGEISVNLIPKGIRHWPAKGNPYTVDGTGKPQEFDLVKFEDINGDGKYNPVNGDYPIIKGEQATWSIYNDIKGKKLLSGTEPIGLEIEQTTYVAHFTRLLESTVFYHYKITNYGDDLDSVYFGFYARPFESNKRRYMATDTLHDCIYIYNELANRPEYVRDKPITITISMMKGAMTYTYKNNQVIDSAIVGMSTTGNGKLNALDSLQKYYLLQGKDKNGQNTGNGCDASAGYNLLFPGYPNQTSGCSACKSKKYLKNDFLITSGPVKMRKWETRELEFLVNVYFDLFAEWKPCPDLYYPALNIRLIRELYFERDGDIINQIPQFKKPGGWSIYPNPANDRIYFTGWTETVFNPVEIEIIGLNSIPVIQATDFNLSNGLDISSLEKGFYIVRLMDSKHIHYMKFIKQ
jgi:Secretion system C-terminal sorting domain